MTTDNPSWMTMPLNDVVMEAALGNEDALDALRARGENGEASAASCYRSMTTERPC